MTSADIFEGIASISQLSMAIAVAFGVYVAWRQLHSWRDELLLRKQADVAEELLASALTVSDELKSLRSPFDSIPKDEVGNKGFLYRQRYERFIDKAEIFVRLRSAQVRAEALLDIKEISQAVDTLFKVRQRCLIALDMLFDRAERGESSYEDDDDRKLYMKLRNDMYGIYTEKYDPLGMEQLEAISQLRQLLKPAIQYQGLKKIAEK
ncbi:hypothetical protein [Yoonia algicola]|uniref:Uncharacterized protein n=1 Tax=Yoonia algicola TaxID=3137368 RepID=A0AAN0M0E3_9RHOB